METILVILWLFIPTPWVYADIPMTPGWFAAALLDPQRCARVLEKQPVRTVCATVDVTLRPIAEPDIPEKRSDTT